MVQVRNAFEGPPSADRLFEGTVHVGKGLAESIKHRTAVLSSELRFIQEDNESNGMVIKPGERMKAYENTLRPILKAMVQLENAHSNGGHHPTLTVQDRTGKEEVETVNITEMRNLLVGAVNEWIDAVSIDDFEGKPDPSLPLAINHEARTDPEEGIKRPVDVLVQIGNGWRAKDFLANSKADEIVHRAGVAAVETNSQLTVD